MREGVAKASQIKGGGSRRVEELVSFWERVCVCVFTFTGVDDRYKSVLMRTTAAGDFRFKHPTPIPHVCQEKEKEKRKRKPGARVSCRT